MKQRDGARGDGDELPRIVWGAGGIAREIHRTRAQTYWLLKRNLIKAARRTGDRWHADVAGLRAQFCAEVSK
jgi:hypothetical protein